VRVDVTPPVSTLGIGEPNKHMIFGIAQVSPSTPLSFSAIDPLTQGFASGVKECWVAIDGNPFQRVDGNFFITNTHNGIHLVRYFSRDNLSNTEKIRPRDRHLGAIATRWGFVPGRVCFALHGRRSGLVDNARSAARPWIRRGDIDRHLSP